jgi:hypothetical protein
MNPPPFYGLLGNSFLEFKIRPLNVVSIFLESELSTQLAARKLFQKA